MSALTRVYHKHIVSPFVLLPPIVSPFVPDLPPYGDCRHESGKRAGKKPGLEYPYCCCCHRCDANAMLPRRSKARLLLPPKVSIMPIDIYIYIYIWVPSPGYHHKHIVSPFVLLPPIVSPFVPDSPPYGDCRHERKKGRKETWLWISILLLSQTWCQCDAAQAFKSSIAFQPFVLHHVQLERPLNGVTLWSAAAQAFSLPATRPC